MLNDIAKKIIIRALRIRQEHKENPVEVLDTYHNLTDAEKAELLSEL